MPAPLATWAEMNDGTYELADVVQMHIVLDELEYQHEQALKEAHAQQR